MWLILYEFIKKITKFSKLRGTLDMSYLDSPAGPLTLTGIRSLVRSTTTNAQYTTHPASRLHYPTQSATVLARQRGEWLIAHTT